MRRTFAAAAAVALLALASCSSADESATSEGMSDDDFIDAMSVGDYASMDLDGLDTIAEAFCADLANFPADMERSAAVIVIRDSVDTDLEAYEAAQAMTERHCPEYTADFDLG